MKYSELVETGASPTEIQSYLRDSELVSVTGTKPGRSAVKQVPTDMGSILACFSPVSKERSVVAPKLGGVDIDVLIATDCISEGQNLQDCDHLVDYDIHWNPVRIVQRFGRIDRIGSRNDAIRLANYWPDVELDEYIKLKARVEERMRITVMTSTGDEPGAIFVLRNVNPRVSIQGRNHPRPFYLVYVTDGGEALHGRLDPKDAPDAMRLLCRGKSEPGAALCRAFNRETRNGRDVRRQARLLRDAVGPIVEAKAASDIDSFFGGGTTSFPGNDVEGLDDFEPACFLAVRPC